MRQEKKKEKRFSTFDSESCLTIERFTRGGKIAMCQP